MYIATIINNGRQVFSILQQYIAEDSHKVCRHDTSWLWQR